MECRVGRVTVVVVQDDICNRSVDAIVNAANTHLWMGGGVAGAIKQRGGEEIEREAMQLGSIAVGAAVATGAGRLAASHVIHAAVMGQDLTTSAASIRRDTECALSVAEGLGAHSLAFPALGTGVGGFPLRECARIMLEAVAASATEGGRLETVEFVLFDRTGYDAFAAELRESEACHGRGD